MKVLIDVTSAEAEIVLFSLALRSKQSKLSDLGQSAAILIGERFDKSFSEAFGWDKTIDRMKHNRKPIKRVTITTYDYPPAE